MRGMEKKRASVTGWLSGEGIGEDSEFAGSE